MQKSLQPFHPDRAKFFSDKWFKTVDEKFSKVVGTAHFEPVINKAPRRKNFAKTTALLSHLRHANSS